MSQGYGQGSPPPTDPEVLRAEVFTALEDDNTHLPYGRTGGPEVRPYAQHAGPSCFYASLIAIQATYSGGAPMNEVELVNAAWERNLLLDSDMAGAQTTRPFYHSQAQFVREHLGLEIEFVDPHYPVPVVHRLVQSMLEKDHAVFGIPSRDHWVALDGLKRTRGQQNRWTGMDPAGGKRIEYPSSELQESLVGAHMPLVIVKNPNVERPSGRFRAAQPRFSGKVEKDKPRFSGKVRPAPRFKPAGS